MCPHWSWDTPPSAKRPGLHHTRRSAPHLKNTSVSHTSHPPRRIEDLSNPGVEPDLLPGEAAPSHTLHSTDPHHNAPNPMVPAHHLSVEQRQDCSPNTHKHTCTHTQSQAKVLLNLNSSGNPLTCPPFNPNPTCLL